MGVAPYGCKHLPGLDTGRCSRPIILRPPEVRSALILGASTGEFEAKHVIASTQFELTLENVKEGLSQIGRTVPASHAECRINVAFAEPIPDGVCARAWPAPTEPLG